MNRFNLPGSFYQDSIPSGASTMATPGTNREAQQKTQFETSQLIHIKTKDQFDLLAHMEFLSYMVIFYQFIKYCHLACLIPLLLHLSLQMILNSKLITHNEDYPQIIALLMGHNDDEEDGEGDEGGRDRVYRTFLHNYCYFLYMKTIFVLSYHALFVCTWVISIVNSQQLDKLQHGTWWLISFIGEDVPDVDATTPYFTKLCKLGLFQLLFTDILILFMQLALYQSMYKQSDAFQLERRLNEKEVFIIRKDPHAQVVVDDGSVKVNDDGIPTVLKIRLYECFESEAYQ
ncbi:hypothetical protein Cantr_05027 [Candida viswanathii]|uniref:Uncharacterized protein n=1 Tax=Candida viswanathii TaxID=5486 RepID=A0A367XPZ5_9ASCO|nr:hypothetical protein Cantr_05027 [Candida viswanathii]